LRNRLGNRPQIHGRLVALLANNRHSRRDGGQYWIPWTGIGAVGTAALGIYLFNEPATLLRPAFIGFILLGIIGLKITS
jgi:hypothetical protein